MMLQAEWTASLDSRHSCDVVREPKRFDVTLLAEAIYDAAQSARSVVAVAVSWLAWQATYRSKARHNLPGFS